MLVVIAAGAIIGLMLGKLRTVEQAIKLLKIVLSIYELPWENYLAVLEVLILVCSSAMPRGTLSTCRSDTPILGSGHVRLYPLDTVPTKGYGTVWFDEGVIANIIFFSSISKKYPIHYDTKGS